jgi:hypothetical protein
MQAGEPAWRVASGAGTDELFPEYASGLDRPASSNRDSD